MIITRKIQIAIIGTPEEKQSGYDKLYKHINAAYKVANMTASHLFMLDNTTPYLSDEDRESLTYLGCKGQAATKANAPYVVASEQYKGEVDMNMICCLQQEVRKNYQADRKGGMYNRSLRSYKANMPIPFKASQYKIYKSINVSDDGNEHENINFTLIGVTFAMLFGRDRSGNRVIVERVMDGTYKMATSSIQSDSKKLFLYLYVDIPKEKVKLTEGKRLYATLGVMNPIICSTTDKFARVWEIGTKDEFYHRRKQIQEAIRRCQIANRYTVGGKGRKRKCQALDRYHDKEKNYVDTKLHTYSRMLVDIAIKHKCSELVLMKQTEREETAKDDQLVLRNWSYYGLKEKIKYKADMAGIKLITL
jgi:hypothetical protein